MTTKRLVLFAVVACIANAAILIERSVTMGFPIPWIRIIVCFAAAAVWCYILHRGGNLD